MKKIFSIITISVLLCLTSLLFVGCNQNQGLYEKGLEMTKGMEELVKSDLYFESVTSGIEKVNKARQNFIANDYDSPTKVYSISMLSREKAEELCVGLLKTDELREQWNNCNDFVKEQILNKCTMQSIYTWINNKQGIDAISFCSLYYAMKQFDGFDLKEEISYLYIFETGKPIIVTFEKSANGMKATAQFLLLEDTTLSGVRDEFSKFGCNVEVIK